MDQDENVKYRWGRVSTLDEAYTFPHIAAFNAFRGGTSQHKDSLHTIMFVSNGFKKFTDRVDALCIRSRQNAPRKGILDLCSFITGVIQFGFAHHLSVLTLYDWVFAFLLMYLSPTYCSKVYAVSSVSHISLRNVLWQGPTFDLKWVTHKLQNVCNVVDILIIVHVCSSFWQLNWLHFIMNKSVSFELGRQISGWGGTHCQMQQFISSISSSPYFYYR